MLLAENGAPLFVPVICLAIAAFVIVGVWKVFAKAGQPGWGCLVPIYNLYLLCLIAGRPGWWALLCFVPIVNIIVGVVVAIDIARAFGFGIGIGLGLAFLGFLFFPVLGYSDARYLGPAAR